MNLRSLVGCGLLIGSLSLSSLTFAAAPRVLTSDYALRLIAEAPQIVNDPTIIRGLATIAFGASLIGIMMDASTTGRRFWKRQTRR
jgi:hypothetical protein